jgi:L-lactate dehydrogenase complex protein LldG
MEESTTREKVLKKIRASLLSKTPNPYPKLDFDTPVFQQTDEDPVLVFADQLTAAGGKFILVENELEFAEGFVDLCMQYSWTNIVCVEDGLSNLLTECELPHHISTDDIGTMDVAVSTCECLIGRTGSILLSSTEQSRTVPAYAPVHVVLAKAGQIAIDLKDAIIWLRHKYPKLPSAISIVTGPSRTADIDAEIVMGVHGPKQLYVFLVDDRTIAG